MSDMLSRREIVAIGGASAALATVTTAAASTSDTRWERLLRNYLLCKARRKASQEFGFLKKAYIRHDDVTIDLKIKYGSVEMAKCIVEPGALFDASFAKLQEAEQAHWDRYSEPAEEAARQLVLCPAPTVNDLQLKVEIIIEHELDNDEDMSRDPWEIVEEDFHRLEKSVL